MPDSVRIGIIGDHDPTSKSHQATDEALAHCGAHLALSPEISWLPTTSLDPLPAEELASYDALWCAPGGPYLSLNGALNAIRWARENDCPLLGTCAGFQHMVVEYARHVLLIEDAQHAEYGSTDAPLVITPLTCSVVGETLEIMVDPESRAGRMYRKHQIQEQYYCNYGLDRAYQTLLDDGGFRVVGTDRDGDARIIEIPDHRFYVGTLFVPQHNSTAEHPHPVILAYLEEASRVRESRAGEQVDRERRSMAS